MVRVLKSHISRRSFLHAGAVAGSGAILGLASSARAASAKVAKETVSYQPSPKGPAHCAACSYFQAPSGCNFVNGPISPSGWCVLFKAK
jgi:anaerobic selenocysteine-containing dehydrogenase